MLLKIKLILHVFFTGICASRHGESHLIDMFEINMLILKYQINPIYIYLDTLAS